MRVRRASQASNCRVALTTFMRAVNLVTFVDPVLSNQVYAALSLSPGSPIPLTKLDNLNYLNADNQGITNLAGLECARHLYGLSLNGDQIADTTPLSWLPTDRMSTRL